MSKLTCFVKGRLPLERSMSAAFSIPRPKSFPEPREDKKYPPPQIYLPEPIAIPGMPIPGMPNPPYCKYGKCVHKEICHDKIGMCYGDWDGRHN